MHGNCWGFGRKYLTKEERTKMLEEYASDLENELKGVKERLKEIKKE